MTKYHALPHQLAALRSDKLLTFLGAGVRAGKTDVGSLWAMRKATQTPPGCLGLICANSYPQLYDSTLRKLYQKCAEWKIKLKPELLPRSYGPVTLRIDCGDHKTEVLCRSLENWETLAGLELSWVWMDEVWATKPQAFEMVLARLADPTMGDERQALLTTTLDEPDSWMYERFVERFDTERHLVIYAPTMANEVNLPAGYVDQLRADYSPRLFERLVEAKWRSLEAGQIYWAFDRNEHVNRPEAEFDESLPILWCLDFNIGQGKPMSSALCQIKKGPGVSGKPRRELHAFDEIVIDSLSTPELVEEFKARPWLGQCKAGVVVYGDATGKAKDTRSKLSDYGILREAGFGVQRVPPANPPIKTRHNAVNSLLRSANGDVRFRAHPRCKTLAKGLETTRLKDGAQYLEKETRSQHITTALGYCVAWEFPVGGGPSIERGVVRS